MKQFLAIAAALLLSGTAIAQQAQQNYPNRPMRLVVPWPPGQATDLVGRVIAFKLSEIFGHQVVVDNRAGAGGMIGTDIVAKAAPDGYTLLAASSGPVTVAPLLQKTPYVSERDLAPVAIAGLAAYVLVTAPSFPAKDIKEFIAVMKNNPGKYNYASSGTGAAAHLAVEYFNSVAGIKATHVPYKGSVPALTDVISGQVAYMTETVSATMPHVRSGKLKAYGISVTKPSPLAPGVPTYAAAADMPGFNFAAWIGIMVSAGTPKALVDKITGAVDKVLQTQDARDKLGSVGLDVNYHRAEDMAAYLKKQSAQVTDIIKKANIKIE
ncbi:MAG: tripartite tricarboxylate transporter substrate binding protein [Burkholderiales bacterium]